jgi:predicted dehydrogenase
MFSMINPQTLGRWALIGTGPPVRFLLERWMLRRDFPFVAVCDPLAADPRVTDALPFATDAAALAEDSAIDGWIVALPPGRQAELIPLALAAGKRLLVEGRLCDSVDMARNLERQGDSLLGVFHLSRPDADFRAAQAAVASGRLGTLRTIRRTDCEYAVPAATLRSTPLPTWAEALNRVGPLLFDRLALLINERPLLVEAWPSPATAGFQARLEYPSQASAWIDVQRASLAGRQSGWIVEGAQGAYRAGRLMTLAGDGELLEEDVRSSSDQDDVENDVLCDLRRLAGTGPERRASLRRAVETVKLLAAIQRSAEGRQPVRLEDLA